MKSSVEVVEPKLFAGAVADEIAALIEEAVDERGSASIVLAGGSTPGAIYRMLGLPPRLASISWQKVHLFWGDERWVPQEDNQSNYRMVRETLLPNVPSAGPTLHPVNIDAGSPEKAAAAYEAEIRKSLKVDPDGVPQFDIVLLGVGEDGHTASLFPKSPAFDDKSALCLSVPHPSGAKRITLTPRALLSARKILFIVTGDSKASVVRDILEGSSTQEEYPARLFDQASENVTWFLDSSAAKKLSPERGALSA